MSVELRRNVDLIFSLHPDCAALSGTSFPFLPRFRTSGALDRAWMKTGFPFPFSTPQAPCVLLFVPQRFDRITCRRPPTLPTHSD